ncbi:MAG: single-stranded DNA-binding protein [bacterium]|nr:single-stranded DNA-binding protein [bacterium]
MINKAILVGNLGSDPVLRSTSTGTPVASFSLATHHRWRGRDGNRQEATEWHNVVCFGRQAEVARQYLRRGRQVYVEGRIQTRSWEDRETGERRHRTEIFCRGFQMLGSATEHALAAKVDEEAAPASDGAPEPEDDDIPL